MSTAGAESAPLRAADYHKKSDFDNGLSPQQPSRAYIQQKPAQPDFSKPAQPVNSTPAQPENDKPAQPEKSTQPLPEHKTQEHTGVPGGIRTQPGLVPSLFTGRQRPEPSLITTPSPTTNFSLLTPTTTSTILLEGLGPRKRYQASLHSRVENPVHSHNNPQKETGGVGDGQTGRGSPELVQGLGRGSPDLVQTSALGSVLAGARRMLFSFAPEIIFGTQPEALPYPAPAFSEESEVSSCDSLPVSGPETLTVSQVMPLQNSEQDSHRSGGGVPDGPDYRQVGARCYRLVHRKVLTQKVHVPSAQKKILKGTRGT